jgi:hypothetical protein
LEAWPFDVNIARQTPEPTQLVGSKPEHEADDSQEHADANQHFPEIFHSEALNAFKIILRHSHTFGGSSHRLQPDEGPRTPQSLVGSI